jgi:hypothetical protein
MLARFTALKQTQDPSAARCPNPRAVHGVSIPVPLLTTLANLDLATTTVLT